MPCAALEFGFCQSDRQDQSRACHDKSSLHSEAFVVDQQSAVSNKCLIALDERHGSCFDSVLLFLFLLTLPCAMFVLASVIQVRKAAL